jgi:hypothetical protein
MTAEGIAALAQDPLQPRQARQDPAALDFFSRLGTDGLPIMIYCLATKSAAAELQSDFEIPDIR